MEERFGQIFDFQHNREIRMENTSYLEDLTGLLAKVANRIDDESTYFFENEYYINDSDGVPCSSYETFINNLKASFDFGSSKKINIIRGKAGIGKSLFFKKGIQRLIKIDHDNKQTYIPMSVDFKNIDNNKDTQFYQEWIYEQLFVNASDCIHSLGNEYYETYERERRNFGGDNNTPYERLFPLGFFCEIISSKYNKPCIVVFDNIDLASVKTQENVFDAIVNICSKFNQFMMLNNLGDSYRVYFVMRPETQLLYNEGQLGQIIDFPLPNILKISLSIMKKVLFETAQDFDDNKELPCNVTCKDVLSENDQVRTLQTFGDVAEYFYNILDYYLQDIWKRKQYVRKRLGTSVEFHNSIVNYNLRTFLRFLADTISNGGFKPLTKEFNQPEKGHYEIFDYIQMIIRGKWVVHPGNKNITGEGSNKAPIIFNLFDTGLYGNDQSVKIKHFMLYIRILQYLYLHTEGHEVRYDEMKQALNSFFDEDYISNATKKLVHVYFIYSYEEGVNQIASKKHWSDITLNDGTELALSSVGQFYLEKIIYEFEYLYQMALSSMMSKKYVDELKTCWKVRKETVVLCFLKSIFKIIQENIQCYSVNELEHFKRLFYCIDDLEGSRPFRTMLSRFILVMNFKISYSQKRAINNLSRLEEIKRQAEELQNKVKSYFDAMLED